MYRHCIKRFLDVLFAFACLLLLSPVYLACAIAVRVSSPGRIIFRQERLGLGGKVFRMYKFRTMQENTEHTGSGVYSNGDDPRLTRVGRFLRKTRLDELPQAVNVLKGDMSLIGPRPPLTYHPWHLDQYTPAQRRMFGVRPGITGWAQIHGGRSIEWHRRIEMNVWYADHVSFGLDLKIFFRTFVKMTADSEDTGGTTVANEPPTDSGDPSAA